MTEHLSMSFCTAMEGERLQLSASLEWDIAKLHLGTFVIRSGHPLGGEYEVVVKHDDAVLWRSPLRQMPGEGIIHPYVDEEDDCYLYITKKVMRKEDLVIPSEVYHAILLEGDIEYVEIPLIVEREVEDGEASQLPVENVLVFATEERKQSGIGSEQELAMETTNNPGQVLLAEKTDSLAGEGEQIFATEEGNQSSEADEQVLEAEDTRAAADGKDSSLEEKGTNHLNLTDAQALVTDDVSVAAAGVEQVFDQGEADGALVGEGLLIVDGEVPSTDEEGELPPIHFYSDADPKAVATEPFDSPDVVEEEQGEEEQDDPLLSLEEQPEDAEEGSYLSADENHELDPFFNLLGDMSDEEYLETVKKMEELTAADDNSSYIFETDEKRKHEVAQESMKQLLDFSWGEEQMKAVYDFFLPTDDFQIKVEKAVVAPLVHAHYEILVEKIGTYYTAVVHERNTRPCYVLVNGEPVHRFEDSVEAYWSWLKDKITKMFNISMEELEGWNSLFIVDSEDAVKEELDITAWQTRPEVISMLGERHEVIIDVLGQEIYTQVTFDTEKQWISTLQKEIVQENDDTFALCDEAMKERLQKWWKPFSNVKPVYAGYGSFPELGLQEEQGPFISLVWLLTELQK